MLTNYFNKSATHLVKFTFRPLRVAAKRQINYDYENEVKNFKVEAAKMRKIHKDEYWMLQTQVENKYLETYKQERIDKLSYDMTKWRTQICNISLMTKNKMEALQDREDRILERMRRKDIADGKRKLMNRYKLDAMQLESRRWPKLNDLDNTISTQFLLPQTILNYAEYQDKLQRIAFHAEQGDYEAMQKLLDKEEVMTKKNSLLQPIYRDIKVTIKHMTYTPEYKLMREYIKNR